MIKYLYFIFILIFAVSCRTDKRVVKFEASEAVPAYGDAFVSSSIGDASYLNPVLSTDTASSEINGLIFNGLVKYSKDLILEGDLAESWDITDEGRRIVFHLRKGVKWHDGGEFTAADVEFTYKMLVDPNVKTAHSSSYEMVKRLRAAGKYTVIVDYSEPFAPALESWGIGIIPKHIFAAGDFNSHPANRKPVGTGPYKFVLWKTDQKIVLEANKDYFEGEPYIRRYIFRVIPDQSVEFLELRNQSIDSMSLTPDQYKAYGDFFENYNKFRYPSFSYTYLAFNLKNPLFTDVRMRHAIASSINKKEIIDGVLLGMGVEATGPFVPSSWAFNPNVKGNNYNPAAAVEALNALGWLDTDKDGWLDKNGKKLEFTIMTNQGNKIRSLCAEIIQNNLKKAGIKVNIRIVEWSTLLHNYIDKKDFEVLIMGWSTGIDPDQYSIWHSSQKNEGQYNFVSYANSYVDSLLEEGRRTFDFEKRKAIYRKMHRVIADDMPYMFLFYVDALPVVHKRFMGIDPAPAGISWNFIKWYVAENNIKYRMNSK